MPHYILDKAYTVNQSGGIPAHRAVVQAAAPGECKLPTGAGAGGGLPLGVSTHAQPTNGRAVAVRKAGVALVEAAEAITPGQPLEIADTGGRVRPVSISAGEFAWTLGFAETGASAAGDLVEVFLSIHRHVDPFVP